jgi:hypothetical protein
VITRLKEFIYVLYIPPPESLALLFVKVQFANDVLELSLYIPPPSELALLPLKVQFVNTGLELESLLNIPPPRE